MTVAIEPASYRDPSGFVYRRDGVLLRQINAVYGDEWAALTSSGLLERLSADGALIPHENVGLELKASDAATAVIRPEPVPVISYPYEWSFSQLRDAALLTLRVQGLALDAGMTLKDATAYNVQFRDGKPILIDTLSFERAEPGAPWIAYRQFCEHFLAPLALMAHRDVRLALLLRDFIDGIPLDLASRLLPRRTRLNMGLGAHVHLHARAQRSNADAAERAVGADGNGKGPASGRRMSATGQRALLDSLKGTVSKLRWQPAGTEWADYTERTNYAEAGTQAKEALVRRFLERAGGEWVWDIGGNTGAYSRIAVQLGRRVVTPDVDPAAVEQHYLTLRKQGEQRVLPLVLDLIDPSPPLGWALEERQSIVDRANADVVMALALVHHLAISRNVPLPRLAEFFARLGEQLIVEFVPKEDSMVRRLLATRRDIFPDYTVDGFRAAFSTTYEILEECPIEGTLRTLFLMRRRGS